MSDAEFIGGKAGPEDNAEWLRWAAETYASAVAKGGCYAPEPEWDVDAISPRLREAAAAIERLRARVEVLELIRRYMGQGVSWDRAEEKAIDEIEERKARAALEAKP